MWWILSCALLRSGESWSTPVKWSARVPPLAKGIARNPQCTSSWSAISYDASTLCKAGWSLANAKWDPCDCEVRQHIHTSIQADRRRTNEQVYCIGKLMKAAGYHAVAECLNHRSISILTLQIEIAAVKQINKLTDRHTARSIANQTSKQWMLESRGERAAT